MQNGGLLFLWTWCCLAKCEELWVFGELVTEGMSAEIAKAKRKNMKIRYFTEDCEEAD